MLARAKRGSLYLGEQPVGRAPDRARVKVVPTIESARHVWPSASRPSSASSAVRADVADPVGERSTSPSAKIATVRWCSGPSSS